MELRILLTALLVVCVAATAMCDHQTIDAIVFEDPLDADTIPAWKTNSCTIEPATDLVNQGETSLKLTDHGGNAQAFVRLATIPDLRYRVEVGAYRRATNTGDWHGCLAVSHAGGRGSSGTYEARSEFIGEPDRWHDLSLEFEARARHTFVLLVGQNATGDITYFDHLRVTCVGVPPVALSAEGEPRQIASAEGVTLAGSPAEIGRRWGELNAEAIRADMEQYFLDPAQKAGVSEAELLRRAEKATALAREFAPHWIEESEAIAAAAGVDPDLYLAFVGSVYRDLWRGDECTSYAVSPEFTEDGRIFFHKNRDNAPKAQCAFLIDTDLPDVNRFISVSDAGVISCMMMVNEKGLAGSADTGGLPIEEPRFRGWMNTSLLRYIAERASDCGEALEIIERFVSEGNYAGGGSTGTHWLFVDRHGTILEVSTNNTRVEHTYHTAKAYMSTNRGDATTRLRELAEPIDFAAFHNVSRDPTTCFPTSISGMSVEISGDHPEMLTVAWITMPARSLALPLFMGGTQTPRALLTGEADMAGRMSTGDFHRWEPIEQFAFDAQRHLEAEVRRLIADGHHRQAREALDEWVTACTRAHLGVLDSAD